MQALWRGVFASSVGLALASCTLIEFDRLVPQAAVSDVTNLPTTIRVCPDTARRARAYLAAFQQQRLSQIQRNLYFVQSAIPQLMSHPIVRAAVLHVQYVSANSIVTAQRLLNGRAPPENEALAASVPKPTPVAQTDMVQFGHTVANAVLRNTGSSPDSASAEAKKFWGDVRAYYTAYYQGTFVNYFTQPVTKPAVQLTIDDAEITQAAGVFLELLFDELLTPTVWTQNGKYYPGGGKAPTYLTVFKPTPVPLKTPSGACGMTDIKVEALTYLANTFATAGSGEVSVSVKSFGGIDVGLGIFGKLNVGDNNTLTALVQLVVAESIKRLTVAVAAPILETIEVDDTSTAAPLTATPSTAANRKGQIVQQYTAPFFNAGQSTF